MKPKPRIRGPKAERKLGLGDCPHAPLAALQNEITRDWRLEAAIQKESANSPKEFEAFIVRRGRFEFLGGLRALSFGRCAWKNRRRRSARSAFTLVEVLISASLMALILSSAYLCLNAAMESQKMIEPRVDATQTARVVLALMSADLRAACPLSKDADLLGVHRMIGPVEADNIDFATHNYTPHRPHEGDFCEVSFFLDKDPRTGEFALWRRRNPTIAPDPLSGGYREQLAKGVLGLRFEYYDGIDWYDSWGDMNGEAKAQSSFRDRSNLTGLPEAIRISLLLSPDPKAKAQDQTSTSTSTNEPSLFFQTVVRLNLADSSLSAPSAGSSTNGAASGGGQEGVSQ